MRRNPRPAGIIAVHRATPGSAQSNTFAMDRRILLRTIILALGVTVAAAVTLNWGGWPVHASLGRARGLAYLDQQHRDALGVFRQRETVLCFILNSVYYTSASWLLAGAACGLWRRSSDQWRLVA